MARNRRSLWLSAFVLLGALVVAQPAQAQQLYVLNEGSSFAEGCIPPCLCPVLFSEDLRGTFELAPIPSPYAGVDAYRVSDINWLKGTEAGEVHITGRGFYGTATSGGVAYQRLWLRLSFDGGGFLTFDSGIGLSGAAFPDIAAGIAPPNAQCFTTILNIDSSPVSPRDIVPYDLANTSAYLYGCIFSGCLCPIQFKNLDGSFDLVPLGAYGMWQEYALVNVDWLITSDFGTDIDAVRGVGIYRQCLTCFAPAHQLLGRFSVDNLPAENFDSGFVNGGEKFPLIDIDFHDPLGGCVNQVFELDAAP